MDSDRFLKMVESLPGWEQGFLIILGGSTKINCLGKGTFRCFDDIVILQDRRLKDHTVVDIRQVQAITKF